MRLLVCTQYFWPESFRLNDLIAGLAASGAQVDVLTAKPNYPSGKIADGYRAWGFQRQTYEAINVFRVPLIPRYNSSAIRLIINYLSFIFSGSFFAPFLLRRRRYDAIFAYANSPVFQAVPGIVMSWITGAPLAIWVQDLWPDSLAATGFIKNRAVLKIVEWFVRLVYWQADLLLVSSEAFIEPVAKLSHRKKVRYYPSAAENMFAAVAAGRASPVAGLGDGFSVVFAGNLGTAQAVETIVEAADKLRNEPGIRIFLVGDGSRKEWIEQQRSERKLFNLILPGRFPTEDMPPLFAEASALLVTLKGEEIWNATLPAKVQTYLAAGRPIVACLNGEGARVVSSAGAGVSCPAEDAGALAEAIRRLANTSEADRQAMGIAGRRYYEAHFERGKLIDDLLGMLQKMGTAHG